MPDGPMGDRQTIYAPSTGVGAIAVIRLSGPCAHGVVSRLTNLPLPAARKLVLREIIALDGTVLDQSMVVLFEEGRSFTGEPMAELHCHGGRAVVSALLSQLNDFENCRLADPGEFTRRAFEAGRMDLSEAEGLSDLVAAETEAQRRQAMRIMSGGVTARASEWREKLIRARALVEVTIDWADEEVPEDVSPEVTELLEAVVASFEQELSHAGAAEKLRLGFEVAIVGPPNVGKSSLLNAIAGREAAIVSERAGTTRDVIEVRFDLDGLPVTFLDTAGLRDAEDEIEAEGISRARNRASSADLRVFLQTQDTQGEIDELFSDGDIRIWSKADLSSGPGDLALSTVSGIGVSDLLVLINDRLAGRVADGLFGHVRQQSAVRDARDFLLAALSQSHEPEVLAENLRAATSALDRLSGKLDVEDVLDVVFGSFCLGK